MNVHEFAKQIIQVSVCVSVCAWMCVSVSDYNKLFSQLGFRRIGANGNFLKRFFFMEGACQPLSLPMPMRPTVLLKSYLLLEVDTNDDNDTDDDNADGNVAAGGTIKRSGEGVRKDQIHSKNARCNFFQFFSFCHKSAPSRRETIL